MQNFLFLSVMIPLDLIGRVVMIFHGDVASAEHAECIAAAAATGMTVESLISWKSFLTRGSITKIFPYSRRIS